MAEHSSEAAIELVELIEHMINHGSSLNMNWGEDTGGYEVDWITSGKRFHGYDRSLTKAMEQAIRSARSHFGAVRNATTSAIDTTGANLVVLFADSTTSAPQLLSTEYDGKGCHPSHGHHYHCANCGEVSSYQGHMHGMPPAFSCAPTANVQPDAPSAPSNTDEALNAPREIREKAELGMTEMTHCTWCQPPTTHPDNHPHSQPSQTVDDLRRENERLRADIGAWDERYTGEGRARFECAEHVERLRVALAESERVSGERLGRIGELRDALIRIEADSRKLGVAPGQLGDAAGRALAGHKLG